MKKFVFVILILFSCFTNAALIKTASIISDTSTGLDWMELTASTDITYNQMLSNFDDEDSIFFGFEYASLSQIQMLFNGEGYSGDFFNDVSDISSRNAINSIFNLFGITGINCCERGDGMFLNENGDLVDWLFYIPDLSNTPRTNTDVSLVRVGNNRIDPDENYWDQFEGGEVNAMGSWIVRTNIEPVPEPTSLAFFGLCILSFFSYKKINSYTQ